MNKKTKKTMKKQEKQFLHQIENNLESEDHLMANGERFTRQCLDVLSLLKKGVVLTQRVGMLQYNIGDTRRRISDLVAGGVEGIVDEWVHDDDGVTRYKKWWMPKFVKTPEVVVYKKNEKASTDYSRELIKSTSRRKIEPVHNPLFDNIKF